MTQGDSASIIDLKEEVRESDNFRLLDAFVRPLVGQNLLRARLAYGDELTLHFGATLPIKHPMVPSRGQWVLTFRSSLWRASLADFGVQLNAGLWSFPPSGPSKPATPEQMAKYADKLAGEYVRNLSLWKSFDPKATPPGLQLVFGDGSVFELLPSPPESVSDAEPETIADWELFTPYHTYIRVGPGPVWSNLRSDVALAAG